MASSNAVSNVIPFPDRRYPHSHDSSAHSPEMMPRLSTPPVWISGRKEARPEAREGGEPEWLRQEREQAAETARTRTMLLQDLTQLGLPESQADLLLAEHEWVRLAWGLAYTWEEMRGGKVRSPAGLFVWWLKRKTGRPVFR